MDSTFQNIGYQVEMTNDFCSQDDFFFFFFKRFQNNTAFSKLGQIGSSHESGTSDVKN